MTRVRVVLATAPDRETAETLVRQLVEERRAACGTILPGAISIYRWKGAVERAEECVVLLKVRIDAVDALVARAAELHPYEVPELLVLPVESGLASYLSWVEEESGPDGE